MISTIQYPRTKVHTKSILVVSRNEPACAAIHDCFGSEYRVDFVSEPQPYAILRRERFEIIFIDVEFLCGGSRQNGYTDYRDGLLPLWQKFPSAEIIVLSPQKTIREAVNAVKAGASNYLPYPIDTEELKYVTESVYESRRIKSELAYLRDRFWQSDALEIVQMNSPLMKRIFAEVRSVAPTETTVLINGETGTGKGVVARLIHRHSRRSNGPFISVHCGAIPETLLESELFGHEKGAFTGAIRRKPGKFEIARGGTIFLDEIGTISPSGQIKLLNILQDKTFHRVGGEEMIEADVRIIAASNADLKTMSENGLFRRDLYYRLEVFPIEIPPLRERREDIPLLVEVLLKRLNKRYQKDIRDIHAQVMEAFHKYSWPGNIRELENVLERAYILESSSLLMPGSFPSDLLMSDAPWASLPLDPSMTLAEVRQRSIEKVEQRYLRELLNLNLANLEKTADAAGIGSRQLRKLMRRYDIRKEEFRKDIGAAGETLELRVPVKPKAEL